MKVKGVYIFSSDNGTTLFSRKMFDIPDDLVGAFINSLKDFFKSFSLGGLVTFASENYIFYLASEESVTTALIVDKKNKSDNYFNLAYEISRNFYNKFHQVLESKQYSNIIGIDQFDLVIDNIILYSEQLSQQQMDLIKLYKLTDDQELESFIFESDDQLFNLALFVAVNRVTKKIFVVENSDANVSNKTLYLTNKAVSALNSAEFRSKFKIRNISDFMDFERLVLEISKILNDEAIPVVA